MAGNYRIHRFFLLSVFILLCFPLHSQSVAQLDADNGFMGIPLGKPDSLVRYLIRGGKTEGLRKLRLPEDKLKYQGIPLVSVTAYAFRDRFHSIDIKTTGPSTQMMLNKIKEKYGPGEQEEVRSFFTYWKGERVYLFFEKSYLGDDGKFSFTSLEVHKDYLKYIDDLKYGK